MKDYAEASKMDRETLEKTRDFCDAVIKIKFTGELIGIMQAEADRFGVSADDLEKVSRFMLAVADDMEKRGW